MKIQFSLILASILATAAITAAAANNTNTAAAPSAPPQDFAAPPPDAGDPPPDAGAPPPDAAAPSPDAALPPDPTANTTPANATAAPLKTSAPAAAPDTNAPAAAAGVDTVSPEMAERIAAASNELAGASTPSVPSTNVTGGLILNFHNAPLEAVLNYLSEAAGLVVVENAEVRGKVDVFSSKPLNTAEALAVINTALTKNGYAANLQGNTLTVDTMAKIKSANGTPVYETSEPDEIPKTDEVVTQILPIRTLNAGQLVNDLRPLLPDSPEATLTANESGNSLIMTATRATIHRIAEIIKALDGSAVSDLKVFPLKYGDSKAVAQELKDLFTSSDSSSTANNPFARGRFGRGGGFPFFGGGGGGGNTDNSSEVAGLAHNTAKVNAVSDDNSNSVIVSAPPDYMEEIKKIIEDLDAPQQDVTEVRVFPLKNADPLEMATLITTSFPSDTSTSGNGLSMGFRFGPFGLGGGGGRGGNAATSPSDRMKRSSQVVAVADQRTSSVVVTASSGPMEQIANMIKTLDSNDHGRLVVEVIPVENAEPSDLYNELSDIFPASSTSKNSSSQQNNNPLASRLQNNASQQGSSSSSSSGIGGGSGMGGGTGALR